MLKTLVEKLKTLEEHYEGNAKWVMLMMLMNFIEVWIGFAL